MTAFDTAWDLTKYSMDSRGEPNRMMSRSGKMRTGGNLPGPKDLNEFLGDMRYREAMMQDTMRMNADTQRGMVDEKGAAEGVLTNYLHPRNAKMARDIEEYNKNFKDYENSEPGMMEEPSDPRRRRIDPDEQDELLTNLISALGLDPDIMSSGVPRLSEEYYS